MAENRKVRFEQRRADATETRQINAKKKIAETGRRDQRMLAKVKAGKLPFPPDVMSWLSRKLDKPSGKITAQDVAKLNG